MPIAEPYPELDELLRSMGAGGHRISEIDASSLAVTFETLLMVLSVIAIPMVNLPPDGVRRESPTR